MEPLCEITIEIGAHRKEQEKEIRRVCMVEWAFRDEDFFHVPANGGRKSLLQASAMGTLFSGEDEKEIIERLERAVWRVNGGMCHVEVTARRVNRIGFLEPVGAEEEDLVPA